MQAHLEHLGSKVPEVMLDHRVRQGSRVSKVNKGQLAKEAHWVMQDSQAQMDSQEILEIQELVGQLDQLVSQEELEHQVLLEMLVQQDPKETLDQLALMEHLDKRVLRDR